MSKKQLFTMRRILTISLISIFFSTNLFSQKFHSEIEAQVFTAYKKDSINYLFIKSLLVIDSLITKETIKYYQTSIDKVIQQIPPKEIKEKKEKRRIKLIYDLFHKKFFKKYEQVAYFSDMFTNGTYNCVSATALYAYVFDELKIPYHIKEAPSHVYLIAYPKTFKIYLETTVPSEYGFIVPKDSEIKKIVNELVNMKLISTDELSTKGYQTIYEEFYYGKEFVDKSALIGMQYFNKAIEEYDKEDYISSQNDISKSLQFHDSPMSDLIYKQLLHQNIYNLEYGIESDIYTLLNYFSELEFKKDYNANDVNLLLYTITTNDNNNIAFLEKVGLMFSDIENAELKKLCLETLYEYIARQEIDNLNIENALKFSLKVIELNRNSKIAKKIIIHSIQQKTTLQESSEQNYKELEEYYLTYSFFENDKRIESSRALLLGYLVVNEFSKRNAISGSDYLDKLNNLLDSKKEFILVKPTFYTMVYLTSGRYFYGIQKYTKAKEIFKRGLEFVPENNELKRMLDWTTEDMN